MDGSRRDVKHTMTRDYSTEIPDVRVEGIPEWGIISLTCRVLNRPISQDVGY
jgi:hypothetical protein